MIFRSLQFAVSHSHIILASKRLLRNHRGNTRGSSVKPFGAAGVRSSIESWHVLNGSSEPIRAGVVLLS